MDEWDVPYTHIYKRIGTKECHHRPMNLACIELNLFHIKSTSFYNVCIVTQVLTNLNYVLKTVTSWAYTLIYQNYNYDSLQQSFDKFLNSQMMVCFPSSLTKSTTKINILYYTHIHIILWIQIHSNPYHTYNPLVVYT